MAHPAANLKGMDLVKWLDTKLGDTQVHWCSRQAAGVLSKELLTELATCFSALEMHVKLKLIQSIPHLSPKLLDNWREPLENLLHIAQNDSSEWVKVMAELYSQFPSKRFLKFSTLNPNDNFSQTVSHLSQSLATLVPTLTRKVVPEDFIIATPQTTKMMYGYTEDEPKQHFKLRRPSKAQALLEDALKTAESLNDPNSHKKAPVTSYVSSLPIRMRNNQRRMDVSMPMKGIKSANPSKISGGFTNEPKKFQRNLAKREGGAMLLDISDLPQPHLKKRRGPTIIEPKAIKPDEPKEPKKRGRKSKAEKEAEQRAAEEAKNPLPSPSDPVPQPERQPEEDGEETPQPSAPNFEGFPNNFFDSGYQMPFSPFFQQNSVFPYQPQQPIPPQINIPQQPMNFSNFNPTPSPSFPEGFFGNDIQ